MQTPHPRRDGCHRRGGRVPAGLHPGLHGRAPCGRRVDVGPASSPQACVLPTGLRPPHGPVSSPRACAPQHRVLAPRRLSAHGSPTRTREGGRPAGPSWGQRSWAGPFRLWGSNRDPDPIKCRAEALAKDSVGTHLSFLVPGPLPWEASPHPTIVALLEWRCRVGCHVLSTPGSEPPGPRSPWRVLQSVLRGTSRSAPGGSCFLPSSRGPRGDCRPPRPASSAPPVPPRQPP